MTPGIGTATAWALGILMVLGAVVPMVTVIVFAVRAEAEAGR